MPKDQNQFLIISNINSLMQHKGIDLSANEAGICFALAMSFLRQELNLYYNPDEPRFFDQFLEKMSEVDSARAFYDQFELDQKSWDLSVKTETNRLNLENAYNIWAVLDLAFWVYSQGSDPYHVNHIFPNMNSRICDDLKIAIKGATSYRCDQQIYDALFCSANSIHSISPFFKNKNAHYLISIPQHLMALSVYEDGSFVLYDPNYAKIIRHPQDFIEYKDFFLQEYIEDQGFINLSCYLVDSTSHKQLDRHLSDSAHALAVMHKSFDSYIQMVFKTEHAFLDNWDSGYLEYLYFSNSPNLKKYRAQVIADIENIAQTDKISVEDVLRLQNSRNPLSDFCEQLTEIAGKTQHFTPLEELIEKFGDSVIFTNELLLSALDRADKKLARYLIDLLPPQSALPGEFVKSIDQVFVWSPPSRLIDTYEYLFKKIASRDLLVEHSEESHTVLWCLENQCIKVAMSVLPYVTLSCEEMYKDKTLIDYVLLLNDESLKSCVLKLKNYRWSSRDVSRILQKCELRYLQSVFEKNPALLEQLEPHLQRQIFSAAFLAKDEELMELLLQKKDFDCSITTIEHIMALVHDVVQDPQLSLVSFLLKHNAIEKCLKQFIEKPENDFHKDTHAWAKILYSVFSECSQPCDQKLIGRFLYYAACDQNFSQIERFLSLPFKNLNMADINAAFRQYATDYSLAYTLLSSGDHHGLSGFKSLGRYLTTEDIERDDKIKKFFSDKGLKTLVLWKGYDEDALLDFYKKMPLSLEDFLKAPQTYMSLTEKYPNLLKRYAQSLGAKELKVHRQDIFMSLIKKIEQLQKVNQREKRNSILLRDDYTSLSIICKYAGDFMSSSQSSDFDVSMIQKLSEFLGTCKDDWIAKQDDNQNDCKTDLYQNILSWAQKSADAPLYAKQQNQKKKSWYQNFMQLVTHF